MRSHIPIKTPAGQEELASRQRRVSQRHRTMLLLVDGRRTEDEVRRLSVQAGVPEVCFDELVGLGLIALPEQESPALNDKAEATAVPDDTAALERLAEPLPPEPVSHFGEESELPALRTLPPESDFNEVGLVDLPQTTNWPETEPDVDESGDPALEIARDILLKAVQKEAPVAGSLTIFRLRRARNRAELEALMGEVASRIGKPPRTLAAAQVLRRVRNVLEGRDSSPMPL